MVERVARRSTLEAIAAPVSSRRRSSRFWVSRRSMTRALSTATPASSARRVANASSAWVKRRECRRSMAQRKPTTWSPATIGTYMTARWPRATISARSSAESSRSSSCAAAMRRSAAARGACPDVAQSVDRPALFDGVVVGRLVAGDDLDRARRLLADQHVAVLDFEALGEALRDVDERAFGRPAPGAATLSGVLVVGCRLGRVGDTWRRPASRSSPGL